MPACCAAVGDFQRLRECLAAGQTGSPLPRVTAVTPPPAVPRRPACGDAAVAARPRQPPPPTIPPTGPAVVLVTAGASSCSSAPMTIVVPEPVETGARRTRRWRTWGPVRSPVPPAPKLRRRELRRPRSLVDRGSLLSSRSLPRQPRRRSAPLPRRKSPRRARPRRRRARRRESPRSR